MTTNSAIARTSHETHQLLHRSREAITNGIDLKVEQVNLLSSEIISNMRSSAEMQGLQIEQPATRRIVCETLERGGGTQCSIASNSEIPQETMEICN